MRPVVLLTASFACWLLITPILSSADTGTSSNVEFSVGERIEQLKQLIHKDTTDDLRVPPVYDRPLGSDAGPRVHVQRFIVNGVNPWPSFGITPEKIDELAERARIELQSIHLMNEYGLTDEDLAVIGRRLQETLYKSDEDLNRAYGDILEQVKRDKKYREEMSIGQLQEVANRLTDYYRSAGFVIAQIYVPQQDVSNGIVYLEVSEGVLGDIRVEDNVDYTEEVLRQRFEPLLGKTVQKATLENALLSLSDYPGLIAYGVLTPGQNPGESDLVIKVQEEETDAWSVRVENYGSELTGEYRLTLSYDLLNPLSNADELNLNILQAFSPTNTLYGDVTYSYPLTGTDYLLGASASSNAFDIGGEFAVANVTGTVNQVNLSLSNQFVRSRSANAFGRLQLNRKVADSEVSGFLLTEDIITSLDIEFGFDRLDKSAQAIDRGVITLSTGFEDLLGSSDATSTTSSRTGNSGAIATSEFIKLKWELARLQLLSKYQNILYRFSGQWSEDLLVSVEQAGIGGPANVRAFPVSEYLRDKAVFLSVDWNFNAPGFYDAPAFDNWKWGEILALSVFADLAAGAQNDPDLNNDGSDTIESRTIVLSGVGVAAQLLLPGKMQIRLDVGVPLKDPENLDDIQYYFTFSYSG